MVGPLDSLRRAGRQQMSGRRAGDAEPYAIVMRRSDNNLYRLLNRSLQRLKASGRLGRSTPNGSAASRWIS